LNLEIKEYEQCSFKRKRCFGGVRV
jgi:hypothetical protein